MKTNIHSSLTTGVLIASIYGFLASTAAAQSFKTIPGNVRQLSVGNQSVMGVNDFNQVFAYNQATASFEPLNAQLVTVAVGGGTLVQRDEVWGIDEHQQVFRLNSGGSFQQIPAQLTQIAVGPGFETCHPAEVWGLNGNGDVFRFDFCSGQFNLATSHLLNQISVGEHEVWGVSAAGSIFHWNFTTFVFEQVPGILNGISAGPAGAVWGLNQSTGKVFRLSRNQEAAKFLEVASPFMDAISVGGNGVWGLSFNQEILRFDEATQKFVQVPGALESITVGNGGGVWGLDASQNVLVFKTE